MKNTLLIIVLFSMFSLSAQNIEKEKEAIKKVIQTAYVEGLQNEGNADKIDSGIHPDFNLLGIDKENAMWKYSITDWKAKVVKKRKDGKLPLTGEDMVSVKFKSVDVTGTAAVAKIEFYVGSKLTYVDYISLYKFENGWKMVNKIFYKLEN
ncbi:MAG: hypothetical protein DRJ10_10275 [Bacteroidetes bacterium]|nr:MAG: hypothetical protein DRJ10_10275 [Bacteroidota bacterium]